MALLVRLLYWSIFVNPQLPISGDALFYYEAAHSIAETSTYAMDGQLTAAKPPGYPIFAGMALKLFKRDVCLIMLQYIFGVLAAIPIFLILRNYLDQKKAQFVILAYLFYPTIWHWESQFMSESLFIWLTNLFLLFMYKYLKECKVRELCFASIFGAFSLLTRPAAIFTLGIIYGYLIFRQTPKAAIRTAAVTILIFIIVFCPWIVRNFKVFGHFIPNSTSGGITLYSSYVNWGYDMSINNPLPWDQKKLVELESAYEIDKVVVKRTFQHLKQYPLKIITLAPMKIKDYFHPFDGRWYPLKYGSKYNIFYGIVLSLAAFGIYWNWHKKLSIVKLATFYIIGGVISVLVFHGEIRYRFVLCPLFFILAGLCFVNPMSLKMKKIFSIAIFINLILWGIGTKIP